jgi:hypothetical protein
MNFPIFEYLYRKKTTPPINPTTIAMETEMIMKMVTEKKKIKAALPRLISKSQKSAEVKKVFFLGFWDSLKFKPRAFSKIPHI